MKIKKGFVVRNVAGESVVIALGAASKSFNGIIKLNDTGRVLWDKLVEGCDEDALLAAILSEYDIDENTAKTDIARFIDTLKGANVLE